MNIEKVRQLIEKYLEGEASLEEERRLGDYLQDENIPDELKSYAASFEYFKELRRQSESEEFNPFAKIDAEEVESDNQSVSKDGIAPHRSNRSLIWTLRVAAGFILLLIGFSAGQFLRDHNGASSSEVAALHDEVQQMKQALMYSGNYSQVSAGERLSAVNLSEKIPANNQKLDQEITEILIHTMNNDKSVNVRMAAADALFRFRNDPLIQKALVNSLSEQEDPQMQITLINMLVQIKAKGALNEMNKLLVNSDTREVVKQQLKAGIAELRT